MESFADKMAAKQREFHMERRLQIFNVSLSLLKISMYQGAVPLATQVMVMRNVDELCGFTPEESDRARDMLFSCHAEYDGLISEFMRKEIAKCGHKLAELFPHWSDTSEDSFKLWLAIYRLFEIDSFHDEGVKHGWGLD